MPDTPGEGDKFAVDLYEIARSDLQPLADLYSALSRSVDQSNEHNLNPLPATGLVDRGQGALRSGSQLTALRKAKDSKDFLNELHKALVYTEKIITDADDEIYENIEMVQSAWSMREIAIPAPPGTDEIDTESFHHESSY